MTGRTGQGIGRDTGRTEGKGVDGRLDWRQE